MHYFSTLLRVTSLADSQHNYYDKYYCYEYSIKTPDDGQ